MEMNKEKFLKFIIAEIERNQKDMYKTGEGKKIVEILTQIYTLTSDGKFDAPKNNIRSKEIAHEIEDVKRGHRNFSYDTKEPVKESFLNGDITILKGETNED